MLANKIKSGFCILLSIICMANVKSANSKDVKIYLFYSHNSENLNEIDISVAENEAVFDDLFGPAAEELPQKVKIEDFYVSKFPDSRYVFTLKSNFNCGKLGCNTKVYSRDSDGDLQPDGSLFPIKCKEHGTDKLICVEGGYKPKVKQAPKPQKRGPAHYPAPI